MTSYASFRNFNKIREKSESMKLMSWKDDLRNKVKEELEEKIQEKIGDHDKRIETTVEIINDHLSDE